jgi:aryl-alcohol dehydrogenase-like predicted oxidoreductase
MERDMQKRKLGNSNLEVSALGLGCIPIPGTRKLDRLDENLGSVSVVLTADDLREIEGGGFQDQKWRGPGIPRIS